MPLDDRQRQIVTAHATRLLEKREWPKTICPSEIARALSQAELDLLGVSSWRDAMDDVRHTLWHLRERGEVEVLQKGLVVAVSTLDDIHGPIRVRAKHQ